MKKAIQLRETFIVGDVHGCFKEFLFLLKKAGYQQEIHRLILVGDAINRGPDSFKVLKWLRQNGAELVRGNHEQAFIKGLTEGGALPSALKKLKEDMKGEVDDWLKWLLQLPFYIEDKDFLVVHAGLLPGKSPKKTEPHILMNIRTWDGQGKDIKNKINPAWHSFYKGSQLVIYGHWAEQGLQLKDNSIGLDTGCVYGHKLSGVWLPERKIFQVSALKKYYLVPP